MRHLVWLTLILVACSGPTRRARSVNIAKVSSDNHKCGSDAIRTGEVLPDGEPIRYWMPCWDYTKPAPRHHRPTDPAMRAELARAEATQCIGFLPGALERSPFAQINAIHEVVPRFERSTMVGAHVVFEPVPGLTASWMRRAIACHRARWRALGRPADYLPGDPTLVEGVAVEVNQDGQHIVVRIDTDGAPDAKVALERATDLSPQQMATR